MPRTSNSFSPPTTTSANRNEVTSDPNPILLTTTPFDPNPILLTTTPVTTANTAVCTLDPSSPASFAKSGAIAFLDAWFDANGTVDWLHRMVCSQSTSSSHAIRHSSSSVQNTAITHSVAPSGSQSSGSRLSQVLEDNFGADDGVEGEPDETAEEEVPQPSQTTKKGKGVARTVRPQPTRSSARRAAQTKYVS